MAIVNDEAFVAGTADGEIGGAFGALGFLNDLLAEWIEALPSAVITKIDPVCSEGRYSYWPLPQPGSPTLQLDV